VSRDGAFSSRRGTGEGLLREGPGPPLPTVSSRLYLPRARPNPTSSRTAPCLDRRRTAWYLLRGRKLGAKSPRQCRLENWVIDFYSFQHRLAIELDGGIHSQPTQMRKDAAKEDNLRARGIRLLRIANGMVEQDPGEFLRKVREAIAGGQETTPHPSRDG